MPVEDPIPSTFAFLVNKMGQFTNDRFAERVAPLGLRPRLCRVLELLNTGSPDQLTIASAMGVSHSVVVTMLDELETLGATRRVRQPPDRRRQHVELTGHGRALLRKTRRLARQLDHDLLAPVDPDQAAALRNTLRSLASEHNLPHG